MGIYPITILWCMTILGIIALIGAAVSAFFFRKGGIYNPTTPDDMKDFTDLDYLPESATTTPEVVNTTETAPKPLETPPTASKATLENLCKAIALMEGANPANHNPGNCRYSPEGYLPIYGKVGRTAAGFAIFKDDATGWLYLRNLLKMKIKNHPHWTLVDLFKNYAPASDGNDPMGYAAFVAKRLGVDNQFRVKNLIV